ncbi:NUDIX hydrolase [Candidatus Uhrbacteria bacterium]|nr:NUDIX hydrolase [Candidatus Uhrbacteria bacterium]
MIPASATRVFKGTIFDVYQWEQELFDGSRATFEMLKRPDTVQVIAVVGDCILVLDQEQPGSKPFVCLPGGRVDEEEDVLEAAKRELREETGYASDDWVLHRSVQPMNKIAWLSHTFIARNARRAAEPHPDAGERIRARLVTFEEFLQLPDDPAFRRHQDLQVELLRARYEKEAREALRTVLFG